MVGRKKVFETATLTAIEREQFANAETFRSPSVVNESHNTVKLDTLANDFSTDLEKKCYALTSLIMKRLISLKYTDDDGEFILKTITVHTSKYVHLTLVDKDGTIIGKTVTVGRLKLEVAF